MKMWAVFYRAQNGKRDHIIAGTNAYTRKDAKMWFERDAGQSWEECERAGYSCKRITVTVEGES